MLNLVETQRKQCASAREVSEQGKAMIIFFVGSLRKFIVLSTC